ncbi:MAG: S24 family peptidase [Pseudomonadota bacterium]
MNDTYGPDGYDPPAIRAWISRICEAADLSPTALAKKAKLSASTINRFMKPSWPGNLTLDTLERLEKAAIDHLNSNHDVMHGAEMAGFIETSQDVRRREGVTPSHMPNSEHEITLIPVFSQEISAGDGAFAFDEDFAKDVFAFSSSELSRITDNTKNTLALVKVAGDSMWPTLHDGDQALVDHSVRRLGRDGIYIIRAGVTDDIQVKRIQHEPRGTVAIISDNAQYRTYDGVDPGDLAVIGRVVWIGRKV